MAWIILRLNEKYYLRQFRSIQHHLVYLSVNFNTFSSVVQIIFYLSRSFLLYIYLLHVFFHWKVFLFICIIHPEQRSLFASTDALPFTIFFILRVNIFHDQTSFFSHRFYIDWESEKKEVTEKFPFSISESNIIWFGAHL